MGDTHLHRWRPAALTGDVIRGAISFGGALFVGLLVPIGSIAFFLALGLAAVFGWYLAGTISRLRSLVEVNDDGLRLSGGLWPAKTIKWAQLDRFELRYFSLKRDRSEGWMDLKLRGGGQTLALDDRLDRFHEVLARAFEAARASDVGLSDTTHANLIAAGIIAKPGP
ncbi:MAG: hypothetical protein K8S25_09375 [Alphaproteobacteria bacterium]|nr:hypothetical protein [Alphaproteobacteria bacterium]